MVFGLAKEKYYSLIKLNTLLFYGLLLLVIYFSPKCHAGQIWQISCKAASAMLLIPGLEFHLLCQLEAEETFTFNAYDASLR